MISIIVPIYNAEEYLQACIESLIRQTEEDLQLILVNDGSTDESPAIARSYAAHRNLFATPCRAVRCTEQRTETRERRVYRFRGRRRRLGTRLV